MNANAIQAESLKMPSYGEIDRSIRRLKNIEPENTFLPASFGGQVERLVRIYGAVKPLLTVMTTLPLIPSPWRNGLAIFMKALDAVVAGAGEITPNFKAGKDL